ncbi:hypothetical protein V2J09_020357 [Rumex salicifolius]
MAFYADEDDVWKCLNHPSRRRRIGVCAPCLREKLSVLCPDCAMLRPCACCSEASSSSSSSHSMISFLGDAAFNRSASGSGVGSVGRVSNFIDTEPSFRRSRSVALPIFKSLRFSGTGSDDRSDSGKSKSRFWMFFWPRRLKRDKIPADEKEETVDLKIRAIARSKSVAASNTTFFAGGVVPEARSVKSKGWYFPSPMKVFRQSKPTVKIIHERSPLNRVDDSTSLN